MVLELISEPKNTLLYPPSIFMLLQFDNWNVPCDTKLEVNVGCWILVPVSAGKFTKSPFLLDKLNP